RNSKEESEQKAQVRDIRSQSIAYKDGGRSTKSRLRNNKMIPRAGKTFGQMANAPASIFKAMSQEGYLPFEVIEDLAVFQGDIVLGTPQDRFKGPQITFAEGIRYWENSQIAYTFADDFRSKERVLAAIEEFHQHTNVRFVSYEGQENAIVFVNGRNHCL